jgi:hypothetical protein
MTFNANAFATGVGPGKLTGANINTDDVKVTPNNDTTDVDITSALGPVS